MGNNAPSQRFFASLAKHWLVILNVLLGIWVTLPFMAPVLMKFQYFGAARAVYQFYSLQCHQLPQRSYFMFGERVTYWLDEIGGVSGAKTLWGLRNFVGNERMGYKVAWSDRMVSLYTSIFIGSVVFMLWRKRMHPLSIAVVALAMLPLVIDGGAHMISDLQGIGRGFRDSNLWLSSLTNNTFPVSFYVGDQWGSFNSIMRLFSGAVAGLSLAWFLMPQLDKMAQESAALSEV